LGNFTDACSQSGEASPTKFECDVGPDGVLFTPMVIDANHLNQRSLTRAPSLRDLHPL